jgi:NarL family two-component system response regulator YdfI
MIRVLIKASTPVGRAGLESLLRSYASLQVVEDAISHQAWNDVSGPDVIVAQIEDQETQDIQQMLENDADSIPVVLVGGPALESSSMLRAGVRGVLPSTASAEQIVVAIHAVAAGLAVCDASEGHLGEPRVAAETRERLLEPLTDREIEVLRFLADGFGNKEIASRMGISEHTVKFHVASIMGKLGAANRTEAVISGVRHGLVMI